MSDGDRKYFDELKTHLSGRQILLRSKSTELVQQESTGFCGHFAVRELMHEAALSVPKTQTGFLFSIRNVQFAVRCRLGVFPSGEKEPPARHSG